MSDNLATYNECEFKLSNMINYIEKVVYINLEHRTDRKELIEKELSIFPNEKVVRFNAIKDINGHIGASKSHIEVLKLAIKNDWKNVLIVEDDAKWHNLNEGYPIFEKLIKNDYDVILFGFGECNYSINKNYKLSKAISATAYLIKNHYYPILLENFEESLHKLSINPAWYNCIDQGWHKLMVSDNWYGIYPVILYQREGYSDIEKRHREISGIIKQKVLAYYFPQYHSFPENDMIFGNNFTDWDLYKNKSTDELSLFKQPIQPPNGLGYYDPTLIEVRKKQASLAKKYGIDGFIYYHYWLENHAVMNNVLDKIIEDNEPDIPFCICFTNEAWKHNYGLINTFKSFHADGSTFRQLYDNPKEHALYLQKLFNHPNYIKINNMPVLFVYMYNLEVSSYLKIICDELKQYNINDLYIVACASYRCLPEYDISNIIRKPNAYAPFSAHNQLNPIYKLPKSISNLPCIHGGVTGWNSQLRHPSFKKVIDYTPIEIIKNTCRDLLTMKYDVYSPQIYTLFAWNEWTEGAIVEPNSIYGEDIGNAIKKSRDIVDILCNNSQFVNTIFEYGFGSFFINITKNVHIKCIDYIENSDKWVINIPKDDYVRPKLFGDPLPGVVKVIKVSCHGITTIYDNTKDIIIELYN